MLWDEKQKPDIQRVIDVLLLETTGVASVLTPENQLAFLELVLSSHQPSRLTDHAHTILREMNKNNYTSIDDFEALFKEKIHEKKHLKSYKVHIPFSFNMNMLQPRYHFAGYTFVPSAKDRLPKFVFDSIKYQKVKECKYSDEFFFLVLAIKSTSPWSAFSAAFPLIVRLRGLLEFSIGKYNTRIFSPRQQPLRKIAEPAFYVMVADKDDWDVVLLDVDDTYNRMITSLSDEQIKIFNYNIGVFAKYPLKNSVKELIFNSLVLYIKALDARFNYEAFLSFWQLAETLMVSSQFGGKTENMVEKFIYFSRKLKTYNFGLNWSIKALASKRNAIVHSGSVNVSNEEVQLVRILCDTMLGSFIQESDKIKTVNHLTKFFKINNQSEEDLSILADVLKYISDQRKYVPKK